MQIRPTAFTIGLIIYFSIALFCVYTEFGIDSKDNHMCRIKPLVAAFYCIIPCPGLIVFLCQQNNRNIQSCDTLTSVPEWQGKNYNHEEHHKVFIEYCCLVSEVEHDRQHDSVKTVVN